MLEFIGNEVVEGEYTASQLAAGILKLKMGKKLETIDFKPARKGHSDRRRRGFDKFGKKDASVKKGFSRSGERFFGKGEKGRSKDGKSFSKEGRKGIFDGPRHKKASSDKFRRNTRPKSEKLGISRREN